MPRSAANGGLDITAADHSLRECGAHGSGGPAPPRAGPGGGRYEHYAVLQINDDAATAVSKTLARLACGQIPNGALRAYLSARLVGLRKPTSGIRVLGCGGVQRRLVARAVAQEMLPAFRAAVGPLQFKLQEDGTGRLHRLLSAMAARRRSDVVIMSVDVRDAFSQVHRQAVVTALQAKCPDLLPLALQWLRAAPRHVCDDGHGGPAHLVEQVRGLDQGCPLSPAMYALTMISPLSDVTLEMQSIDPQAVTAAYLNDTYLIGTVDSVQRGVQSLTAALASLGLALNDQKTKFGPPIPMHRSHMNGRPTA